MRILLLDSFFAIAEMALVLTWKYFLIVWPFSESPIASIPLLRQTMNSCSLSDKKFVINKFLRVLVSPAYGCSWTTLSSFSWSVHNTLTLPSSSPA